MTLPSFFKEGLMRFQYLRRASRFAGTAVVAFYWDGSVPLPHPIRDISRTGMYVTTSERWYLGTLLHLTVDANSARTPGAPAGTVDSMMVWSKVVRHGDDGVGLEFVLVKPKDKRKMAHLVETAKTLCEEHYA